MTKQPPKDFCCLHENCPVMACPEPVCAMEFPGGIAGYLRSKEIKEAAGQTQDIEEAAKVLNISESAAQRRYKKATIANTA